MPVAHRRALQDKKHIHSDTAHAKLTTPTDRMVERCDIEAGLAVVAATFAPSWPLRNFVASNPLAGLESANFDHADQRAQDLYGARTLMSLGQYGELFRNGRIQRDHLLTAVLQAYEDCGVEPLGPVVQRQVDELVAAGTHSSVMHSIPVADRRVADGDGHVAHWVARMWGQVGESASLWASWRVAAQSTGYRLVSRNRNLRPVAACLSHDPHDALVPLANLDGPCSLARL